jgi:hypothetical protein
MVLVRLWMRVAKAPLSVECLTGKAVIVRGPHPHQGDGKRPTFGSASVQRRVRKVLC